MTKEFAPWDKTVLYQNYPWNFKEDESREPQLGNGSILGILEKLSYLVEIGIDAIWVSPPYPGPMKDAGYDISDFTGIHPELGTLEDFDRLVEKCHESGIRVMLDYIPNHSSDQHEWFQKSRNREPGYEDYYIWKPGKLDSQGNLIMGPGGIPIEPNNWPSVFSKPNRVARANGEMRWLRENDRTPPVSAWQWDELRGEYYLRTFVKEQPDLNWKNDDVAEGMLDNMRFWIDRGVDGFRMDAFNHMAKNHDFPDEEINPDYNEQDYDNPMDQYKLQYGGNYMPEYERILKLFCGVAREYRAEGRNIQLVVESYMDKELLDIANRIDPEVATTFNFEAFRMPWDARKRKEQLDRYYSSIDVRNTPNQVNGNHDNVRLASRLGDAAARAAGMMNLLLPGMRVVYSGEELGLHDGEVSLDRMQDPNGLRDGARTPIIWDDGKPNAGFSNADSEDLWLPINENDLHLSVSRQERDSRSSLAMYRAVIQLCHELPAVRDGDYVPLDMDNEQVLTFGLASSADEAVVLVNFSSEQQHTKPQANFIVGRAVLSSIDVLENIREVDVESGITLRPNEALTIVPA